MVVVLVGKRMPVRADAQRNNMTMKTLGILGGMSWESTAGLLPPHQPGRGRAPAAACTARRLLLASVDFAEVAAVAERGGLGRRGCARWAAPARACVPRALRVC